MTTWTVALIAVGWAIVTALIITINRGVAILNERGEPVDDAAASRRHR